SRPRVSSRSPSSSARTVSASVMLNSLPSALCLCHEPGSERHQQKHCGKEQCRQRVDFGADTEADARKYRHRQVVADGPVTKLAMTRSDASEVQVFRQHRRQTGHWIARWRGDDHRSSPTVRFCGGELDRLAPVLSPCWFVLSWPGLTAPSEKPRS